VNNSKNRTKTLVFFSLVFVAILVLIALLPKAVNFTAYIIWLLSPFIISYFLSLIVNPMVDSLERRFKLPRGFCAIIVIVFTVGVIGGIVTAIIWKIVDEIRNVIDNWQVISDSIIVTWETVSHFMSNFVNMLPKNLQNAAHELGDHALGLITNVATNNEVFSAAGNFAKRLPGIFIVTVVFILSLYFMITDAKKVSRTLRRPFSEKFLKKADNVRGEIKKYVGGYVKAQLIIMCVSFTIILTGLYILKIDYAPLIALGIAIFDALPFFGSGAILWPWAAVALISGKTFEGVGLVIIYLAVILTRQFIEPKIVSKKIGIHPLITLMSMYVGFKLFSIGGMIFGPLVMVVFISFYRAGVFDGIIFSTKMFFKKFACEIKNIVISLSDKENDDEQ